MSLFDASHALINTWTFRTAEPISAIGGNCYGWFAFNQFSPLAFDNAELRTHTPRRDRLTVTHHYLPALHWRGLVR
jgi:hypothetical protein